MLFGMFWLFLKWKWLKEGGGFPTFSGLFPRENGRNSRFRRFLIPIKVYSADSGILTNSRWTLNTNKPLVSQFS